MTYRQSRFASGYRGGNPRGGRTWRDSTSPALPLPQKSQTKLQEIFTISQSPDEFDDKVEIEDVEYVTSFSWKGDESHPTILVPGKPPRWQPPRAATRLSEDRGEYYRDQNSARFPLYPIVPAILAIRQVRPDFDVSEIDIFGCGNTLGSLLSFVQDEERSFRFGVHHIGSSLFLIRQTNTPAEIIEGVRGYGHTFPEAYTIWERDVSGSESHQRLIKYDFAGLKCFVRSESDGYLPDLVDEANNQREQIEQSSDSTPDTTQQLLALALGMKTPATGNGLRVRSAGREIPQRALFDLKTRSIKSKTASGVSIDDFLQRLWVNQTPNFILAFHDRGQFESKDIHVVDIRRKVADWQSQHHQSLSKFGSLLHKLIKIAQENPTGRFEVRRIGSGPMQIWSQVPGWSALPPDLIALWNADGEQGSDALHAIIDNSDSNSDSDDTDILRF